MFPPLSLYLPCSYSPFCSSLADWAELKVFLFSVVPSLPCRPIFSKYNSLIIRAVVVLHQEQEGCSEKAFMCSAVRVRLFSTPSSKKKERCVCAGSDESVCSWLFRERKSRKSCIFGRIVEELQLVFLGFFFKGPPMKVQMNKGPASGALQWMDGTNKWYLGSNG